jgi:thiosulfate dehydrogenase (quinone) large subunit
MDETKMSVMQIPEPALSKFFFADSRFAWFWLIVRLYVGWQWLYAGWEKLGNPVWTGSKAGVAIQGFLQGALQKTSGEHPDVSAWYAALIQHVALPHVVAMSYIVTYSEIAIGIALILGLFTGIAAFMGSFWSMNYLFAGTVSINPLLFLLELFLVLAWRSAGYYGLDRWLLPMLGTPWQPGKSFKNY